MLPRLENWIVVDHQKFLDRHTGFRRHDEARKKTAIQHHDKACKKRPGNIRALSVGL
jgi:hypothetical protein